jgi:probable rRNA maturation factor
LWPTPRGVAWFPRSNGSPRGPLPPSAAGGRNKPTNVLTFDSGDVILAAGVVRREAQAAGRRASHVLAHLVVHGALHLRGHDHGGAGEARRMELQEARILHGLRVPNPWRRA